MRNSATKILQLRKLLRSLRRQYKVASEEEERAALSELRCILRKKLTTLTRAE